MNSKILFLIIGLGLLFFLIYTQTSIFKSKDALNVVQSSPSPSPPPPPVVLKQAVPKEAYTIVMVGDSMTEALGPNSDKLREALKVHYGEKVFGIFNLAKGSTSLLTLQELLDKDILDNRQFEVILIESFGYNPLSELPLEEGLKKQTEILDKTVKSIREAKSDDEVNSIIVFIATIAPNKEMYGQNQVDLSPEVRAKWVSERTAYIENHIKYAGDHDIPLVNVYEKSLKDGTGNLDYIEGKTYIHPSDKGIELISKEIADFLFNNRILPP